jgi:hypothetical protein
MRLSTVGAGPRWLAAGAAMGAAAIHAYVAPEHLREWWLYGGFFIGVTAVQLGLAWLVLRRPTVTILLAGIWGTVGLIGIYVASRTTGLPLGPAHSHSHRHALVAGDFTNGVPHLPGVAGTRVEAIGAVDLAALGVELLLIVVLVGLLPSVARRTTTNLMMALAVAAWGIGAGLALA